MNLNLQVIGKTGQLARALNRRASEFGHNITCYGRELIDLTSSPGKIEEFIARLPNATDAVVIAAAYTAVDKAETDQKTAFAVNGIAPKVIAEACAKRGFSLVHISTDYVFDGYAKMPYKIDHPTNPVNIYGASKREGEIGVVNSSANSVVLRTSWLFDGTGKNFLTTILSLGASKEVLNIVDNQFGRPTYAGHLADAVIKTAQSLGELKAPFSLIDRIYHVSNNGPVISWADYAKYIFKASPNKHYKAVQIQPISASEFPSKAQRPAYSALDPSAFERQFSYKLPHWKSGIRTALSEVNTQEKKRR
ncbi:dTDP-4-dehydrorhamnose reductase [Litorimonas haliclonae]|uniref:dTDP-4-dehydrorhamnose reductase n=1 Tax=Litorimonas haliclonae TaxID=2081977 RepID=UPI0039EEB96C